MDDIFGTAKRRNEYRDLLTEYDLLHNSATSDIDFPFLDCDAVSKRIMKTHLKCSKPSLDPAMLTMLSALASITTDYASNYLQPSESNAMSQSVISYSSRVILELSDLSHASQATFAIAEQRRDDQYCQQQLSQADSHCRSNKTPSMLDCRQSCEQSSCLTDIPGAFGRSSIDDSVMDHSADSSSSIPLREISLVHFNNEAEEKKETTATSMLQVSAVRSRKERHHKRNSRLRRSHRQKCKRLERLQKELTKLLDENANLKRICADLQNASFQDQARDTQRRLMHNIFCSRRAFIVTDPNIADNGIVYVSNAFLQMTGYAREQILGRSCRFLQGPRTCPSKIHELRIAMEQGEEWHGTVVNYKADNTPFWNRLFVAALRNNDHEIVNYVGLATEVELPHSDDPEYEQALAYLEERYAPQP